MSFSAEDLHVGILEIFVEAQMCEAHHRQRRHVAWAHRVTESMRRRDARDGWPEVVGNLAICRDGWAFKTEPLVEQKAWRGRRETARA